MDTLDRLYRRLCQTPIPNHIFHLDMKGYIFVKWQIHPCPSFLNGADNIDTDS